NRAKSWNDSAQSPAWSRNARPAATSASPPRTWRASPAKTSGGRVWRRCRTRSTAASSGHAGCWSASLSRQDDGDHVESKTATRSSVEAVKRLNGVRLKSDTVLFPYAHLLRHPAHGREALRQLVGGLPAVRGDAGSCGRRGRAGVLLHRRPALDHRRVRPERPARADARPGGPALLDGARPRALHGVRTEPCDGARRGGVAPVGGDELRPARPDDAVQGEGRPAGVRVGR